MYKCDSKHKTSVQSRELSYTCETTVTTIISLSPTICTLGYTWVQSEDRAAVSGYVTDENGESSWTMICSDFLDYPPSHCFDFHQWKNKNEQPGVQYRSDSRFLTVFTSTNLYNLINPSSLGVGGHFIIF